MAAKSQSLETRLGPELFAKFRDLVEQLGESKTPYKLSQMFNAAESVYIAPSTIKNFVLKGFDTLQASVVGDPNEWKYDAKVEPAAAVPPSPQLNVVLRENARLRAKLAERDSGWEIIKGVLEEVYEAPSNIVVVEPKVSEVPGSPEVAVLHVTDVHYGKITPTYNVEVCEARMLQYFQAVSEITELRRHTSPIDEALLLFGGDQIEGEGIFPAQSWETSCDLIEQMVKSGPEYAVTLVLSLAQLFPVLRIKATPGNHGRPGKFMSPRDNADSVFYEIVRKMVQTASPEAASRIEWDLPLDRPRGDQWYTRFNITGRHEGMLVHGDQIKGQLGFPWYGYGKKVAGWRTAAGTRGFNYLWSGHFHTHATFDLNDATVLSTGSPESSNGYALENMAAAGEPKQRLTFFNERYGILADHGITLN